LRHFSGNQKIGIVGLEQGRMEMTKSPQDFDQYPKDRMYRLDMKSCPLVSCGGELAELSYYERNNWVTVEFKCTKCEREYTVKVEC